MEFITLDHAKNVLESLTSVMSARRNLDSSFSGLTTLTMTPAMVASSLAKFKDNFGQANDGSFIRIEKTTPYFKFTVNFTLLKTDEKKLFSNAYDRAHREEPSISVYVNGLKIPDKDVFFYSTKSNTDIYIPNSPLKPTILTTGNNTIVVETRKHLKYEYIEYYNPKFTGRIISIPVTDEEIANCVINTNTALVFVDGKLDQSQKIVSILNHDVIIDLGLNYFGAQIEVVIDSGIKYISNATLDPGIQATFYVPETYRDPLYGPIPKNTCIFFIDGLRVSNHEISQSGRVTYTKMLSEVKAVKTTVVVTDVELIDDLKSLSYASDYFLYNMIGSRDASRGLRGEVTNTPFDGKINFVEILNKFGALYSNEITNEVLQTFDDIEEPHAKISYLLDKYPNLTREFLNNYKKPVFSYSVTYNGTDSYVSIGTSADLTVQEDDDVCYSISINGLHVRNSLVQFVEKGRVRIFRIPGFYFTKGQNTVEILVYSAYLNGPQYKSFYPENIKYIDNVYQITFPLFEGVVDTSDLLVLVRDDKNPLKWYPYEEKGLRNGFAIHYEVHKLISGKNIVITFESLPAVPVVVISKRFVHQIHKKITAAVSDVSDIFIPLHFGTEDNPIPIINNGKVDVYVNEERLLEGIDYFVKTPLDEGMTTSVLVLKRKLAIDSEVNVYFSGVQNEVVHTSNEVLIDNPYGLFYIGELTFPFSLRYMDVYANGKKLTTRDVDVLSDKLIRIHSLETPLYDVHIETAFSVGVEYLKPYMGLYREDNFELAVADLFYGVDYSKPKTVGEEIPPYNDIYESFVSIVDSVDKRLNPVRVGDIDLPARFNTYKNAFLLWMLKGGMKAIVNGEEIPFDILRQFQAYKSDEESWNIIFDQTSELLDDIYFDIEKYPNEPTKSSQHILEFLETLGRDVSFEDLFKEYEASKASNILHPEDVAPFELGGELDSTIDVIVGGIDG